MRKNTFDFIIKRFVLILMLIIPCVLFSESFYGKCVGVSDGDTISVMNNGRAIKIRINGIDCPEMGQDFGRKAKQYTSDLVFGKYVEVHDKGLDKYGRTIAVVFIKNNDIGLELIKAGLAWHYKQYSSDPIYASAEQEAKNLKNGLWSFENPKSPWDFRHNTSKSLVYNSPTSSSLGVSQVAGNVFKTSLYGSPTSSSLGVSQVAGEVYITSSGAKYHSAGCRYLSKSAIPISLNDAIARGYSPCSVCGPPSGASSLTSSSLGVSQVSGSPTSSSLSSVQNVSGEVYITRTGAKYHSAGCRYLSKSAIPISLNDAIARGYSPCSICGPSSSANSLTSTTASPDIKKETISESIPGSNVVYITNTGAKYHSSGCRYLSKSAIPISLNDAITRGYSPCSICGPSSGASSLTSTPTTITGTPTGATTPRGHQIYVGPRGGLYHYSKSGKKVYERKKKY